MITLLSGRHAADVFAHLRRAHDLSIADLARRIHAHRRTVSGREAHTQGIPTDALIDTAAVFGFDLALVHARHPGARPTGTGWPA